jgi:hypothetical protein
MGQKEFDENWSHLAHRLNLVSGLRADSSPHILCERMRRARVNYTRGEALLANAQLANVQFLVEDFERIRSHDSDLFSHFKRELKRCIKHESYFGLRMEIRMASTLIAKNVAFEKSEAPDFVIIMGRKFGIECTSAFLQLGEEHQPKDLDYKIQSSIRKKTEIIYHTFPLILTIDISNLLFHDGKPTFPNVLIDMDKLRPKLEKLVANSIFDSMLAFFYYWTPTNSGNGVKLTIGYNRYDSPLMAGAILNFLDKRYPMGDSWQEGRVHEVV